MRSHLRTPQALFRQIYAPGEPASFNRAMGQLRQVVEQTDDAARERRRDFLTRWAKAHGTLRQRWMENLIIARGQELGRIPPEVGHPNAHITPEQILSAYFYGEHLHWDRGAAQVEEWSSDPFWDAHHRLLFLTAMAQLSTP